MVKTQRKPAAKPDVGVKASVLRNEVYVAQVVQHDSTKVPGVNNSLLRSVVMAENMIDRLQKLIDGIDGAYPAFSEPNSGMAPRGER